MATPVNDVLAPLGVNDVLAFDRIPLNELRLPVVRKSGEPHVDACGLRDVDAEETIGEFGSQDT